MLAHTACSKNVTFAHMCTHLLGRIEKAQSRIQALQGDTKPSPSPAPAPKPQKPKTSNSAKQGKTKSDQPKATNVKARVDSAPSAPVVETAAVAAGYSADYGWCQVELPVGPSPTGVSTSSLDTRQMCSVGSTLPIAGRKSSENVAAPNEFVAWETQRIEVACAVSNSDGPVRTPNNNLPNDTQAPDTVEDSPKTRKVRNLADASLDSPNTRKAREEIMVRSYEWSNLLRLQRILGLFALLSAVIVVSQAKVAAAQNAAPAPALQPREGKGGVAASSKGTTANAGGKGPQSGQPTTSGAKKKKTGGKKKKKR